MFSQGSTDPVLEDKGIYKTLIRLGPPFDKLGAAFVQLCKHFKWDRLVMISRRKTDQKNVFCDYSSRSNEKAFRDNNITLAEWIVIDDGISDVAIDDVLDRIKQRGRSKYQHSLKYTSDKLISILTADPPLVAN